MDTAARLHPVNVRLTAKQVELVKRLVAEGRYLSASEVIREGLRLLAEEIEWRAEVRKKLVTGMEQLRAGQVVEGEQAVDEVLQVLRKRRRRAKGA